MNARVWGWFTDRFGSPTQVQREAFPAILAGKDVLITSPTGTGKTLSAFLGIISRLADLAEEGRLENRVYCVYVAPLKALAADIEVNLRAPLEEMAKGGFEAAGRIRVGVRTGDTTQGERRAMNARPPHIFITTPESFCLSVASPVSGLAFDSARHLVVDELHDLMQSRRGALLALFAGLLESRCGRLQRIGISATLADTDSAGRFLTGEGRDPPVVCRGARGKASMTLVRPREDLLSTPLDRAVALAAEDCVAIAKREGTTIVFTNTRADAESLGQEIGRIRGKPTAVHHGSVAEEERRRIEKGLRDGSIDLAVCSSSLELGIDIGGVGAVVVFGSPGGLSRTVQRVGRSGHRAGEASKGFLIPRDLGDLLEMEAILAGYGEGALEEIAPPDIGPDLLMQFIVGASTRGFTPFDSIARTAARAGCLGIDENAVALLAETLNSGQQGRLVEIDEDKVRATGRGRMILFQNIGAVTNAPAVRVRDVAGSAVGTLSPGFAAELSHGEVIALGGGMYTVVSVAEREVVVEHSPARFPTVPAWGGEGLVRSRLVREHALNVLSAGGGGFAEIAAWRAEYRKRGLSAPGKKELHIQTMEGEGGEWTLLTGILDRKVWAAFARMLLDAGACGQGAAALDDGLLIPGRLDLRKINARKRRNASLPADAGHVRLTRTALAARSLLAPETVGDREVAFSARSRRAWALFEELPKGHPLKDEEERILKEETVRFSEAANLWDSIIAGLVSVRRVEEPMLPLSRALLARGARELLGLPRMLAMEFAHAMGIEGMLGADAEAERRIAGVWQGRRGKAFVSSKARKGWGRFSPSSRIFIHPSLSAGTLRRAENVVLECARLGVEDDALARDDVLREAAGALAREGAVATVRVGGKGRIALTDDVAESLGMELGLWQLARARGALALKPASGFGELLSRYPLVRDAASARARGVDEGPDLESHLQGRYAGGRLAWTDRTDVAALVSLYDAIEPDVDLSRLPKDGGFDAAAFRLATGLEPRDAAEAIGALEASGRIERLREKGGRSILYRLVKRRRRGDWRPLLARLVEALGAVTPSELTGTLNLDAGRARDRLAELVANRQLVEIRCGLAGARYYASAKFVDFARGIGPGLDGGIRCLPSRDPAVLWDAGESIRAVVFRDLVPVGSVLLEPAAYLGHARVRSVPGGLTGDDLAVALREVGVVMFGRAPRALSIDGGAASEGWQRHGGFSVRGGEAKHLSAEEASAIVLSNQHLCRERAFDDADKALAFLGAVDSDLQLAARSKRGKTLAALVREGKAVKAKPPMGGAGAVVPALLPLYGRAMGAKLSGPAGELLAALRETPFTRLEVLAEELRLSPESTAAAGDELVDALMCWRSPDGRLVPVKELGMSRGEAVAEVVMAEISRCGLVRAEELAENMSRMADGEVLSDALDALWDSGRAKPVFALKGADSLYWMPAGERAEPATGLSVVPPDDRAWPVLAELNPEAAGTAAFLVFRGGKLLGSFTGSVTQRRLAPSSIVGGPEVSGAGKELAHRAGLAWGREIPQTEDWEVLDWWERTRGFGKEDVDFG